MSRRRQSLRYRSYDLPEGTRSLVVPWERFSSFEDASARFPNNACVYTFQGPERTALYVGKATGLRRRYSAACGALSALVGHSQVRVFAAPVDPSLLDFIEHTIIFWDCPPYNERGKFTRPLPHVRLLHEFRGVTSPWGSGYTHEVGATYEGPQFCRPGDMREADTGELH